MTEPSVTLPATTLRWFGEPWGAPICTEPRQIDTPVGDKCASCGRNIQRDDQGVSFVAFRPRFTNQHDVWHFNCYANIIMGNNATVDLGRVDWGLLRKQKDTLLTLRASLSIADPDFIRDVRDALDGMTHLLDHIQDEAAKQLGDEMVFGPPEEDE